MVLAWVSPVTNQVYSQGCSAKQWARVINHALLGEGDHFQRGSILSMLPLESLNRSSMTVLAGPFCFHRSQWGLPGLYCHRPHGLSVALSTMASQAVKEV